MYDYPHIRHMCSVFTDHKFLNTKGSDLLNSTNYE